MEKYYQLSLSLSALAFFALYIYRATVLNQTDLGFLFAGTTNALIALRPIAWPRSERS